MARQNYFSFASYNLYWTTLITKKTFSANIDSNSVAMKNLPYGILPEETVLILMKSGTETGSTVTLDAQIQVSHDDSVFFDFTGDGNGETQWTQEDLDGIHYVPDAGFLARFWRVEVLFGGATNFADLESYAIVASQVGERAVGLSTRVSGLGS